MLVATTLISAVHGALAQSPSTEGTGVESKRLTKGELTALLTGATVSGRTPVDNGSFEYALKADGTFDGFVEARRNRAGVAGQWTIAVDGLQCLAFQVGPRQGSKDCGYWTKSGDQYEVRETDEPNAERRMLTVGR
jgi:hypothetical protein